MIPPFAIAITVHLDVSPRLEQVLTRLLAGNPSRAVGPDPQPRGAPAAHDDATGVAVQAAVAGAGEAPPAPAEPAAKKKRQMSPEARARMVEIGRALGQRRQAARRGHTLPVATERASAAKKPAPGATKPPPAAPPARTDGSVRLPKPGRDGKIPVDFATAKALATEFDIEFDGTQVALINKCRPGQPPIVLLG